MTKQKIACVYLIENLMNGKKYIGQSINYKERKYNHKCASKNKISHLYNSIRKDGWENFEFIILMKDNTINYDNLDFWECYFIELFDTLNREKGYNMVSGGHLNRVFSEESREKISKGLLGVKKHTEYRKQQLRDNCGILHPSFGLKHTKEAKEKMSMNRKGELNAFFGKTHTNKSKELQKQNMLGGKLFHERVVNDKTRLFTTFNFKTVSISLDKFKGMAVPLIVCTRIWENNNSFQPTLMNDMLNFVQNIDLKTIINID